MPKVKTKTTKLVKTPSDVVKTKKAKSIRLASTIDSGVKKDNVKSVTSKLSAPLFDIKGIKQGEVSLPQEIFGAKPSGALLAQAIRIYFANQSAHFASTKTRAEVRGGGRKPHRQKGTGKARAGSIRSPLWVGGGVALGPKPRKVKLSLPKKMRRKALIYALSAKQKSGDIKVIANIEKIPAKTKVVANLLEKLNIKGSTLFVVSGDLESRTNLKLATRNIPGVFISLPQNLNAYEAFKNNNLLISREALAAIAQSRANLK